MTREAAPALVDDELNAARAELFSLIASRACSTGPKNLAEDEENPVAAAIDNAEEFSYSSGAEAPREKPRLLVENCDPHHTVAALRDILSKAGGLYDRGVPVRLAFDQIQAGTVAQVMTPDAASRYWRGRMRNNPIQDGLRYVVGCRPRPF